MFEPDYRFNSAILRSPARSRRRWAPGRRSGVLRLRGVAAERAGAYVAALETAGLRMLPCCPPWKRFRDSVFVEDPALVFTERRDAPPTRRENASGRGRTYPAPVLAGHFDKVLSLGIRLRRRRRHPDHSRPGHDRSLRENATMPARRRCKSALAELGRESANRHNAARASFTLRPIARALRCGTRPVYPPPGRVWRLQEFQDYHCAGRRGPPGGRRAPLDDVVLVGADYPAHDRDASEGRLQHHGPDERPDRQDRRRPVHACRYAGSTRLASQHVDPAMSRRIRPRD